MLKILGDQHLSINLEHNDTNNIYYKTKKKYKKNNFHKSNDLNPQLNKSKCSYSFLLNLKV